MILIKSGATEENNHLKHDLNQSREVEEETHYDLGAREEPKLIDVHLKVLNS